MFEPSKSSLNGPVSDNSFPSFDICSIHNNLNSDPKVLLVLESLKHTNSLFGKCACMNAPCGLFSETWGTSDSLPVIVYLVVIPGILQSPPPQPAQSRFLLFIGCLHSTHVLHSVRGKYSFFLIPLNGKRHLHQGGSIPLVGPRKSIQH